MTKTKNVASVQGTPATHTTPSIESLMAQFAQMQAVMQGLIQGSVINEPAKVEPAKPAKVASKPAKVETAVKEPAKPQTRKEGIAAWKAKKDAKTTEQPAQTAILQVSEKGRLLVGNMAELEIIRVSQGLEKYLTYVKRKSVNGKVYDGYSFSYKRMDMITKAFNVK
jgi:hypothetical protein